MKNKTNFKLTFLVLSVLFVLGILFFPLSDNNSAHDDYYKVDFDRGIVSWGAPEPYPSFLEKSINLPYHARYEVWTYFNANSGNCQKQEEYSVRVNGRLIGSVNDPNNVHLCHDEYVHEYLGEHNFQAGNNSVKVEHRWNYSDYGTQSVYPKYVKFVLKEILYPDFSIEKEVNIISARPNDILTYTLNIENTGMAPAVSIILTDDYDEENLDILDSSGGTISGGKIIWNISEMPAGASFSKRFQARIKNDLPIGTTYIDNSASIFSEDTGAVESNTVSTLVEVINNPPVANAGPNRQVNEGQTITLNGSGYDPDGDPVTYSWTCNGGILTNPDAPVTEYTAPEVNKDTAFLCILRVYDDKGAKGRNGADVLIINNVEQAQVETNNVSNIEINQAVLNGTLLDLGGADSVNVWFEWGTTSGYSYETSHQIKSYAGSFNYVIYGLQSDTTYHFRAVAQNNEGIVYGQDKTFTTLSVPEPPNNPPSAYAGPDKQVNEGQTVILEGSGYDLDQDPITYNWECTSGNLSDYASVQPVYTSPLVDYDTHFICILTVSDDRGGADSDEMKVYVSNVVQFQNPQVETNSVSNVQINSAVLNGILLDLGGADSANVWFEWGTSSNSYNYETSHQTKALTGSFNYVLNSLSPDTVYYFRAVAQNNEGIVYGQDKTFTTLSVPEPPNNPPSAYAGPDKQVNEGQTITLQGSGYDPDNDDLSYFWNCPEGELSDAHTVRPIYTAPLVEHDIYFTCTLTVTDERGLSDFDEMRVLVNNRDKLPQVETKPANNVQTNQANLNGNLLDLGGADSVNVWFEWGTSSSYTYETFHQVRSAAESFDYHLFGLQPNTTYHFRAVAQNNEGIVYGQDKTFTTLSVPEPPNNPPSAYAGSDKYINEGESTVLSGFGSDPDGDLIRYSWQCNGGSLSDENISNPVYTAPSIDHDIYYICVLEVSDNRGGFANDQMTVYVNDTVLIQNPQVETNSAGNVQINYASLNGTLLDLGGADSANVWFEWGTTSGYSYETSHQIKTNTGSFNYVIYGLNPDTTYHFRAVAQNNEGIVYGQDKTFTTLSVPEPPNNPPSAYAGPDKQVNEGQTITLQGSGYDPDNDSLNYYWSCTGGILSDSNTAQPVYTAPSVSQDTRFVCTLFVADNKGASDKDSMEILVLNSNQAPLADAGPDKQVDENSSVVLNGSAFDPDGDNMNYYWNCEAGILSNPTILQPTYTALEVSQNTNYICTLTVIDSAGLFDTDAVNILVRNTGQNPQVETNSAGNVQINYASLNGTLLDLGGADSVNVWFEWGTTSGYSYETSHQIKTNTGSFNYVIYGLNPDTTYHFRAVAQNNEGIVYGENKTFTTSQSNRTPLADAGPDKQVDENSSVVLQGSGSDPDNDPITYYWSCNQGELSDRYIAQPIYTAPEVSQNTFFTCVLEVADDKGFSDSDNVMILVLNNISSPEVETNPATNIQEEAAVLNGILLDLGGADSVNVWFEWGTSSNNYNYETSHQTKALTGSFNYVLNSLSPDTVYYFRAVAENNEGITYGQTRTFTTLPAGNNSNSNNAPNVYAGPDKQMNEGGQIILSGSGSDPDNDSLTYSWYCSGGSLSDPNIAQPIYTAPYVSQDRYYSCNLIVTDEEGLSDSDSMNVLVLNEEEENSNNNNGDVCWQSSSTCGNPEASIYAGDIKEGCLNSNDNKFYRVGNSAGKRLEITLNFSGSNCNVNDLTIYNSSCNNIDSVRNSNWTKVWEGISSSSDMVIGIDGDSSNDNCQWRLVVDETQEEGDSILTLRKYVRNITREDTVWYSTGSANPDDRLMFKIEVVSSGSYEARDVMVKDILPAYVVYEGNLRINNVYDSRNITTGIDIGDLIPGQTKVITFEARAAPENSFSYGTTEVINTATAYNSDSSDTDTAKLLVLRTGVAGATTIPTGFTNNVFLDSFLLPLAISAFLVWLFRSKIINFGRWLDFRKDNYQDYKAKKVLQFKIAKIKGKEFIKKKLS